MNEIWEPLGKDYWITMKVIKRQKLKDNWIAAPQKDAARKDVN